MSDLDLKPFCSTDRARTYLHQPFSIGEYTYATNGHIMVRVARRPDALPPTKDFDFTRPLKGSESAVYAPVGNVALPPLSPPQEGECSECNGRGREHDCPDCECDCEACDGTGTEIVERKSSASIRGTAYDRRYLRMIFDLPGIEIATATTAVADGPILFFRFDGGVGALMALHGRYPDHIDLIPVEKAA